ncbi:MAG TPA: hypothetical protein VMG12_08840 [Polyangiaceae bacterium]|nr:hypothetical protein [Polyangiaceae bacterium]
MRSIASSSRTALAPWLHPLLLGSLVSGCNARLDISEETAADGGLGGTSGTSGSGGTGGTGSLPQPDAGTPSASCEDGVRSGDESDIDCGGAACAACVAGASCARHTDCQSGECRAGLCVASSCEDGIRNGDETDVDCGGACQRCRATTCNCASSPGLTPLGCDETPGYLVHCGAPGMLSADGETFVFAMCYMERADGTSTSGYELFRRRPDGITEALGLGDSAALGLSTDGQRLLVGNESAVSIVSGDGTVTPVPLQRLGIDVLMSGDGASVFGGVANGTGGRTLARWTESGGVETLGSSSLLDTAVLELWAVSHDGSVVAGTANQASRNEPFRWTAAGGVEALAPLPDDAVGAQPIAISADGSTLAGFTITNRSDRSIFRWTEQDQFQVVAAALPVGYLPQASLYLSDDGSFLVGNALVAGAPAFVRWGQGGTVVANAELAYATDITPDGSTLVGIASGPIGFLWQPPSVESTTPASAYNVTSLDTLLAQSGVDSTGWTLETITNISDDGRIIYGAGQCGGVATNYRMQLRP